jgi:subtilisin family serine protease
MLPAGVTPFDVNAFEQTLRQREADPTSGIKFVRTLHPLGALGLGAGGAPSVVVAQMPPDTAEALKQNAQGTVIVEEDHPIGLADPAPQVPAAARDPGVVIPYGASFTVALTIRGKGGAPLPDADVFLYGRDWPTQGRTDANGQVHLTLFGETGSTLRALYVKPQADHWSLWLSNPALDPGQNNIVNLIGLDQADTVTNFPQQELLGWGLRAMKVDQLPSQLRGRGAKVALVDSGTATTHQNLTQQVRAGFDTIAQNNQTWNQDTVFHGTHCSGVVAGLDNAFGIRGIAPEAQLYSFKIFPDGRFSNLIDALNQCIAQQVDVVNLSLGTDQRSDLVEQKILEAKQQGIACIVAAGNSGGPVQFPANSAHVLAVAAIGKIGTFPDNSYHAQTALAGALPQGDGYFPANFSCYGQEIGVAAPGVAIVSSIPPNNFAAWDGTSMAAPHVTALATLIVAHHPDFQPGGPYAARNARRVERLFQIIRQSADLLGFSDPNRGGAGLPNAVKALQPTSAPTVPADLFQQLLAQLQGGAPSPASVNVPLSPFSLGPLQPPLPQPAFLRTGQLSAAGVTGATPPSPTNKSDLGLLRDRLQQLNLFPSPATVSAAARAVSDIRPTAASATTGPSPGELQQLQAKLQELNLLPKGYGNGALYRR